MDARGILAREMGRVIFEGKHWNELSQEQRDKCNRAAKRVWVSFLPKAKELIEEEES